MNCICSAIFEAHEYKEGWIDLIMDTSKDDSVYHFVRTPNDPTMYLI